MIINALVPYLPCLPIKKEITDFGDKTTANINNIIENIINPKDKFFKPETPKNNIDETNNIITPRIVAILLHKPAALIIE